MSTTTTVTHKVSGPPKPRGWCVEQGLEHAWIDGPILTVNPPIPTRHCANCGQTQWKRPGAWENSL